MKKFFLILLIVIVLLWGWFTYLYFNPQLPLSQKVLSMVGITTSTGEVVAIANPASVFCEQNSGTLEIVTDLSGWQSGLCHLSDGNICDEWAYFRGECPTALTGAVENSWIQNIPSSSTNLGNWFYSENGQIYRPLAWQQIWNHKIVDSADIDTFTCSKEYAVCWDKNKIYFDEGGSSWITADIDQSAFIIDQYYLLIKQHKLQEAFAMRNTTKSFTEFENTYQSVSDIVVYDMQQLSPGAYGFYVDTTDSAGKTETYYVKKSIDNNGKLIDNWSTAKAPTIPEEFTMDAMNNFYFSKQQVKYTDVADYAERACQFRDTPDYASENIPSCDKYQAYKNIQGVAYHIYPKTLPSYIAYAFNPSIWESILILPNSGNLSKEELIGMQMAAAWAYGITKVNMKYILLEQYCSSWAWEPVWCEKISQTEKFLKQ